MILVSHLVEELEQLCDYVLWLKQGSEESIAGQYYYGSVEELKDSFCLLELPEDQVASCKQWIVGSRCSAMHQEYLLNMPLRELPNDLRPYGRQAFLKELMYYVDAGAYEMESEGK